MLEYRVKALCRHQYNISVFNESCKCCLQWWGLAVSVWRAIYSLGCLDDCHGNPLANRSIRFFYGNYSHAKQTCIFLLSQNKNVRWSPWLAKEKWLMGWSLMIILCCLEFGIVFYICCDSSSDFSNPHLNISFTNYNKIRRGQKQ